MAENNESTMKWKVDVTQLKSAMQEAKRAMNQANAEFKTATAGMDKWSKSSEGLEAKLTQLNKLLPAQKRQLEILEASYAETVKTMGENSSAAADLKIKIEAQKATIVKTETSINSYTKQLKDMQDAENNLTSTISKQESELKNLKEAYVNAVAQYGKNSDEAKKLANQIQDLSGELADNKKKAADASTAADKLDATIEDAGNTAEKSTGKFEGFGKALANAAKAGIAAFTGAVAGAVTGLTKASVDAAAYADEMITLSSVTGMSKESLQAYSYAADLVDVSMETLTGSMAKNIKSMSSAQKGTGAAAEAYAKLGVAVTDSQGNLRDGETVYWEAIDALGKMEEGAARDALAMQLFGKSAQDLNPLIAQGSEGINELTEEAKAMGAVLSDDQLADLGSFDDSIQRLTQGAGAAKRALGLVLLPELQTLADEGVSLLGQFTSGLIEANGDWSKISEVIGSTVGSLANTLLQQLPNIISVGTSMITAIGSAIVDNLPMIVSTLSDAAVQLALAFADAAPSMVNAGQKAVIALIQGLAQAAPKLIAAIPPMIKGILDVTIQNLPLILQAGISLIQAVLAGLMEAAPMLLDYIPVLIQQVCSFITENLPFLLESGISILMELLNGILSAIPMLLEQLPVIIDTIVTCLMENLPLILDAGIQILFGLINGILSALPDLIAMLPTIIETIVSVITKNLPLILQLGIQTLVKLINGLTQALPQLIAMLPEIIHTITRVLIQNLPAILKMGAEILWELIKGIGSVLVELGKQAIVIGKIIIDEIMKLPKRMLEIGGDIVKGIWEGISGGYDWIKKKIKGWVGNVTDFIKKVFKIGSPSKLMADEVGKWLPEGMAVGFEKDMPSALASMKKSMNSAISNLKSDVALQTEGLSGNINVNGSSGSASGSKQQNITFNQTINSPKAVDGMTLYRQTNSLLFSAEVRLGNV